MPTLRPAALVISTFLLAAGAAQAQQGGVPGGGRQYPYTTTPAPEEPVIADVDFRGGTIRQYIEYLRSVAPNNAVNVVTEDEVGQATVPAIRLKGVTVGQAVDVLETISGDGREIETRTALTTGSTAMVYSLRYSRVHQPPPQSPISVFQVNDIIDNQNGAPGGMPVNTLLTALEQAMVMVGGEPPEVKFHPDSGLLLMKGGRQQMETASELLVNLRDTTGRASGLGGGKWTRSWSLLHASAEDVVRAFRDVFPPGSPEADAVMVESADNGKKVTISAPRGMAVAADVLVRHVDRPSPVDRGAIAAEMEADAMRRQNEVLSRQVAKLMDESIVRQQENGAEVGRLRAQLDEALNLLQQAQAQVSELKQKK
ncbi:MAG TPA: hypothetical protein VHN77_00965 [Phycisphaerales bacterium]|nr:hypothetical protein [Phycisphaerales bacterium]